MSEVISFNLGRNWLTLIQFIRGGGTDVTLEVQYFDAGMNYLARESLTVSTTAVLLASVPARAAYAFAHVGARDTPDAWLRFLANAAPTSSQGTPVENGGYLFISPEGIQIIDSTHVTTITPGTGATNLGKAEDAAHASGDVGVMALAVRTDTAANRSGADGDYEPLQVSGGRVWVSGVITDVVPGSGATNLGKAEDAAHASADVGVMALAVRTDTPTARSGADGDYEPLQISGGRVWTTDHPARGSMFVDDYLASAARTASTNGSETTIPAGIRGIRARLVVTAASGTGNLQLLIQCSNGLNAKYIQLNATPTAVNATGTFVYEIYPGASAGATGDVTQRTSAAFGGNAFRIRVLHADASSNTYSVDLEYLN